MKSDQVKTKGSSQLSLPDVKTPWSTVEKTSVYGPYYEALQFRLLMRLWYDNELRREFIAEPKKVLEREAHLKLPAAMKVVVLEDNPNLFHFALPVTPPAKEFNYRYQQIADWWMIAHYLAVRQLRDGKDIAAVDGFRQALHVMIIGRTWFDPDFKQAMRDNPKAALEKETNATFPPSLVVKSPEDTADTTYFVIPKRPDEEQLLDDSKNLAGWFAAGHQPWYFMVAGRLLRPLPKDETDKLLA